MLNENKTSKRNIIFTIIAGAIALVSSIFITYPTLDAVMPVFLGNTEGNLGLAVFIIVLIIIGLGVAVANVISTVLSVLSAVSIKKNGESKVIFILDIVIAVLPWLVLIGNFIIYVVATSLIGG